MFDRSANEWGVQACCSDSGQPSQASSLPSFCALDHIKMADGGFEESRVDNFKLEWQLRRVLLLVR